MIVIKLIGPNYLMNGSVRYFFWPQGTVKKIAETLRELWTSKFGNCWSREYPFYFCKIHLLLFFHVHLGVQVFSFFHFFFFFHQSVNAFLCPMCATCFMCLIPDLIALIKFGEEFMNTFILCCFNVKDSYIYIFTF